MLRREERGGGGGGGGGGGLGQAGYDGEQWGDLGNSGMIAPHNLMLVKGTEGICKITCQLPDKYQLHAYATLHAFVYIHVFVWGRQS